MAPDPTLFTALSATAATAANLNTRLTELQDAIYGLLTGSATAYAHTVPQWEIQGSDPSAADASHLRFYPKSTGWFQINASGSVSGPFITAGPYFKATSSGTIAVVTSTLTKVTTLTVEAVDSNSNYDTASQRFTPTVSGWYLLFCFTDWLSSTDAKFYQAIFAKNGSAQANSSQAHIVGASGVGFYNEAFTMLQANGSSDYFELDVLHTVGSNSTLNSAAFWGFKIPGS